MDHLHHCASCGGDHEELKDDMRTTYVYIISLRKRLQQKCKLAQEDLVKAGDSHQYCYDKRACEREVDVGNKVFFLLPASHNKLLM